MGICDILRAVARDKYNRGLAYFVGVGLVFWFCDWHGKIYAEEA